MNVSANDHDELDLEERQLCPDGACVGVLGDDGRCKVCGAVGDGSVVALDDARSADAERQRSGREAQFRGDAPDDSGAHDDDDRRLCPDGACIGLIGDDGKCKVCGAAAS